jgi:hypothetical protein
MVLNVSSESRFFWIVAGLKGKFSAFPNKCDFSGRLYSQVLFVMWREFPSFSILLRFFHNGGLDDSILEQNIAMEDEREFLTEKCNYLSFLCVHA